MSSNDYGLLPSRDKFGYVFADDRFSENNSVEDITDGAIRTLPHLLKLEFLHSLFVRGDSGTLHCHIVFKGCLGTVYGDLVVSRISIFYAQVVIVQFNVELRKYQFIFDAFPNNTGHFISIHVYNWVLDFYFISKCSKAFYLF